MAWGRKDHGGIGELGAWYYGTSGNHYVLSEIQGNMLHFSENENMGSLQLEQQLGVEWFIGPLHNSDTGALHGIIRLRFDLPDRVVSNFKAKEEDAWDSNVIAHNRDRAIKAIRSQLVLVDVQHIYSTGTAFAALKVDGSVVSWGSASEEAEALALRQ